MVGEFQLFSGLRIWVTLFWFFGFVDLDGRFGFEFQSLVLGSQWGSPPSTKPPGSEPKDDGIGALLACFMFSERASGSLFSFRFGVLIHVEND